MLSALSEASSEQPDLIIIDYVYVDPAVATALKEKAKQGAFSEELMIGRALTPVDLRHWVENTDKLSFGARRSIISKIFNASCPVYLHTYTPQGIAPVVGSVSDRVRKIRQVFPNAAINSIDMRSELFNSDEFDWPNPKSRRDDQYYPYQLGVFCDQVVQKEVIRRELNGNRFLRVKRTALSVSVVTAIGAAVGFAASWVGSVLTELVRQRQYTEAFIMGSGLLLLLLLVGLASPLLFERWMQKIMPEEELTKR